MSELLRLYDEDRAEDRSTIAGAPGYAEFRARDAARRARVADILDEDKNLSPEELYAAAWIFNHGDTPAEAMRAHELAKQAAGRGHAPARWMTAAALDRALMYAGKPQRYGTNMLPDGVGWRLWDVDPATTDAERAAWDVPPLAEMERRAAAVTMGQPSLDGAPQWFLEVRRHWAAKK